MRIKRLITGAVAGGLLAFGAGCASKSNLPVYDSGQVGSPIKLASGAKSGRCAMSSPRRPASPPAARETAGAQNRIGGRMTRVRFLAARSAIVGAIGPGVVGEAAGALVGSTADDKKGEEITVLVDGGQTITIVQERGDGPPLAQGEKVGLVTGGSSSVYVAQQHEDESGARRGMSVEGATETDRQTRQRLAAARSRHSIADPHEIARAYALVELDDVEVAHQDAAGAHRLADAILVIRAVDVDVALVSVDAAPAVHPRLEAAQPEDAAGDQVVVGSRQPGTP